MEKVGSLHGLPCIELTDEQLSKVNTTKLIECLPIDPRAQDLLAVRMVKDVSGNEVKEYRHLTKQDWDIYTILRSAYNNLLTIIDSFSGFDVQYHYYRTSHIFWYGINDELKLQEVNRFLQRQPSVVNAETVDYEWLDANYPDKSREVMRFVVSSESNYSKRGTLNIICRANAELLIEIKSDIQRLSKDCRLQLLSNPNTPEDWLDELLRIYADRVMYNCPIVRRPLSHDVLGKLPPVTRMKVLENLMYRVGNDISTILAGVDFERMLFGLTMKYTNRVAKLIKGYNAKTGKGQESSNEYV